ncbi:MAG: amidohydrolase [Burkholderiales bacterium]|nr:amidohydrolase [Burkholderiales bacterium]
MHSSSGTSAASSAKTCPPADLILKNGHILTVDSGFRIAQALAVAGERILAVGTDAEVSPHAAPWTRLIDLNGKTVIPGLIDGHAHMDREGLKGVYPSLGRTRSIRDIQDRIADLARTKRPGEWIVTMPIGDPPFYFNVPDILAEKRWPTREDLDIVSPDNPVYIRPIWGFWRHSLPLVSCANTRALELAGITRDTVSPVPEINIQKAANGDPTGVIIENSMQPTAELIWFRKATGFSRADRARTLPDAARAYHAFGTTSIFEEHGVANELLRAYKDSYRDGALTMRASLAFSPNWRAMGNAPLAPFIEAWAGWLGEPGPGDDWLKLTGLYVNTAHTRADDLRAGTTSDTGWAGFNYDTGMPRERLKELLLHCAENDIRAITNAAVTPGVIDLFDEVDRIIPLKGRRWVVGHISTLSPHDIEKLARMELAVTTHTNSFIYKKGHLLKRQLPPEKHREITPMRDLLDAGVKVGLATDNVPVSMFWPIWQVVARTSAANEPVAPEQAISREEALRCATESCAYLTFDEHKKGSLAPGKLADLAVLSADPLKASGDDLRDIHALMTMVGGRIMYEDNEHTGRETPV